MKAEKVIENCNTPLAIALRENFITINDLFIRMQRMYYPCPQRYKIYLIVNGIRSNTTVRTYLKILNALNSLIVDKYQLQDIIDLNIEKEDRI